MTMMKLALVTCMPLVASAAFSAQSSFTISTHRERSNTANTCSRPKRTALFTSRAFLTMYDSSRDPPSSPELNAWHVLSNTEKWISTTLAATDTGSAGTNPYSRKEVSYACETSKDAPLIVAGIFRRLKEARELGQVHGIAEEDRAQDLGDDYSIHTLRQTQVIVIPGNKDLAESFPIFDKLIESINRARRNSRDYVTDVSSLDKLDEESLEQQDWSVSINCAHLHPNFGKQTSQEVLQEMKKEEEAGIVDVNLQEYKERRLLARQSPYPTIVIEVRASPPPDFGDAPLQPHMSRDSTPAADDNESTVSSADVQRLEALFGQTAHLGAASGEESFFDALGHALPELSAVTPLEMSQQWLEEHDAALSEHVAFTESSLEQVDEAYEFVFTNLAMLVDSSSAPSPAAVERQYMVLPHFLSAAATSFEKFSIQVQAMLDILPGLAGKVKVSTFHPEHIDIAKRSPAPVFCLQWNK